MKLKLKPASGAVLAGLMAVLSMLEQTCHAQAATYTNSQWLEIRDPSGWSYVIGADGSNFSGSHYGNYWYNFTHAPLYGGLYAYDYEVGKIVEHFFWRNY